MTKEFHLPVEEGGSTAVDLLSAASGLPAARIKSAMQKGAVWLSDSRGTHRLRRVKKPLVAGSTLHMYYDESLLSTQITAPTLIADESAYSIWYKPPGVLSQGSKWGDHCTLARWVETHDRQHRSVFTVHRLDRAASGLMLLAHGKRTAGSLAQLFECRTIEKAYQAIVHGRFPDGESGFTYEWPIDGRNAASRATLIEYDAGHHRSLISVSIDTGRKHQIRRHLSKAGYPIVGDRLYGDDNSENLQLCAVSLGFHCPLSARERRYELPADLRPGLTPAG